MSERSTLPARLAWEADFPQDRLETQHVTRREFAKFLVVVSGGLAATSAAVAVKDDLTPRAAIPAAGTPLCGLDEIPVGGTKAFVLPGTHLPGILVRPDEGTLRAYEQKCTHLSCAVFFSPERGHIVCPCHNGGFDARSGRVLYGPPPRPLRQFAVEVRDHEVVLVGEAERHAPGHGASMAQPGGDGAACPVERT